MRRPRSRITRRSAASEIERSWLGAEALPGGALPRAAEPPAPGDAAPAKPAAAPGAIATWFAAALRWTRARLT